MCVHNELDVPTSPDAATLPPLLPQTHRYHISLHQLVVKARILSPTLLAVKGDCVDCLSLPTNLKNQERMQWCAVA